MQALPVLSVNWVTISAKTVVLNVQIIVLTAAVLDMILVLPAKTDSIVETLAVYLVDRIASFAIKHLYVLNALADTV